jgi:hypothetical protein
MTISNETRTHIYTVNRYGLIRLEEHPIVRETAKTIVAKMSDSSYAREQRFSKEFAHFSPESAWNAYLDEADRDVSQAEAWLNSAKDRKRRVYAAVPADVRDRRAIAKAEGHAGEEGR